PDEPSTELLRMLLQALRADDREAMRALAGIAVERFGGILAGGESSERYYLYRVLRQLELSELLRRAIAEELDEYGDGSPMGARLVRDEQARRIEELRKLIAGEIRRQLVELRGASRAADVLHDRPIEEVDFLRASPTELRR